jgi:hypothetical protein
MNADTPVSKDQCDTPRTDEELLHSGTKDVYCVPADFARDLERELTETRRELRREESARKVLADENMRLLKELRAMHDDNDRLRGSAARYQYIAKFAQTWDAKMNGNHGWLLRGLGHLRGRTFDEAIDAAMGKKP